MLRVHGPLSISALSERCAISRSRVRHLASRLGFGAMAVRGSSSMLPHRDPIRARPQLSSWRWPACQHVLLTSRPQLLLWHRMPPIAREPIRRAPRQCFTGAQIQSVIVSHQRELRRDCWERNATPQPVVNVVIRMTIAPDGSAQNVVTSGDEPSVKGCIDSAVRGWHSPP